MAQWASGPAGLSGTIPPQIIKESTRPRRVVHIPVDRRCAWSPEHDEWCSPRAAGTRSRSRATHREAGSTAAQEWSFTLKDCLTYVEQPSPAVGSRRFSAAVVVLLQRAADRLLRGDAIVPRGAVSGPASCAETFGERDQVMAEAIPPQTAGVSLNARSRCSKTHRTRTTVEALAGVRADEVDAHQIL